MQYTFYVTDRWGRQRATIPDAIDPVHTDEVNGPDTLTMTVPYTDIIKGDRIVWLDKFGRWHEHTVAEVTDPHEEDGKLVTEIYAENSISELRLTYLGEIEPKNVTATVALQQALQRADAPVRWTVGTVNATGTNSFSWYHEAIYDAITEIVESFAAELQTTIRVTADAVTARQVDILARRGSDTGQVFTYGRNLKAITREVMTDDVLTALYGYGKGLERYDEDGNSTGGYSRKLTFADVNGGKTWVGDEAARLKWGIPDTTGAIQHAYGVVEFSDCEDPNELLRLTKEALTQVTEPRVSYTGDVVSMAQAGVTNGSDSQPGDTVWIRDEELGERLSGRVLKVERHLTSEDQSVITIGNISQTYSDAMRSQWADLGWLKSHATGWDSAAELTDAFLNAVINQWNDLINQTGGYVYWEQGEGITVYDRPLDENPTMAIQLKGGSFRIANSRNSDGSWNWRTFGTGDGFVADLLIAGTIVGGSNYWNLNTGDLSFSQGSITDARGNNWNMSTGVINLNYGRIEDSRGYNFWDLEKGEFTFSAGHVNVGNQTLQQYIEDNDSWSHETQLGVFNRLTANGSNKGLYLQNNELYINATFLKTGIISDGKGFNYWNLDTGEFKLSPGWVKVGDQSLDNYVSSLDSYANADARNVFNKLTNNGRVQGITFDGTNLYINATYINSGTLSVTDANGNILFDASLASRTVRIADFKVNAENMEGPTIKLYHHGLQLASSEDTFPIGQFYSAFIDNDLEKKGVGIGLHSTRYRIDLAAVGTLSRTNPQNMLSYFWFQNQNGTMQNGNSMSAKTLHSTVNWSFHGGILNEAWVEVNNGGGNHVLGSGTFGPFYPITQVNSDGSFQYCGPSYIYVKNGFVTGMTF